MKKSWKEISLYTLGALLLVGNCQVAKAASKDDIKSYIDKEFIGTYGIVDTQTFDKCDTWPTSGVISTSIDDFNQDGEQEGIVLYISKTKDKSFDLSMAVVSDKDGSCDITDQIDFNAWTNAGLDARVYEKTKDNQKYIVYEKVSGIDDYGFYMAVLSIDESGKIKVNQGVVDPGYTDGTALYSLGEKSDVEKLREYFSEYEESGKELYSTEKSGPEYEYDADTVNGPITKYGIALKFSDVAYKYGWESSETDGKFWIINEEDSTLSVLGKIQQQYEYESGSFSFQVTGNGAVDSDSSNNKKGSDSSSDSSKKSSSSNSGDFILPNSGDAYISSKDLEGLSKEEVSLARNEIYARRGRKFNNASIQEYFEKQSWYQGKYAPDDFPDSILNEYETKNIEMIMEYEQSKGWR